MEPKVSQFPDMTKLIADVAYLNNWQRQPALMRFLQDILSAFYRALFDLVQSFKLTVMAISKPETTVAFAAVLVVVIFLLLIFIIVYVVWPRIVARTRALNNGAIDASSIKVVETARTLKQKAERFAISNDFDLAIKCLYLSALRRLHEQSIVPYLPGATNFEYCNLLVNYPQVKNFFRQIADSEELISFAQRKANSSDFDQCIWQLEKLEEQLKVG